MIFNAVGGCVNPYPVGAIYLSAAATSPASLFGGTWERLKDRFLLGAGDTYGAGAEGGNSEHRHLTSAGFDNTRIAFDTAFEREYTTDGTPYAYSAAYTLTQSGNGLIYARMYSDYASGMPPYLTVYMWKRVA